MADPRPLTKSTARIILFAALLLHFSLREQHVTFTEAGVVWRDWPWQGETEIAWGLPPFIAASSPETTVPATSRPGMSDAPGGTG